MKQDKEADELARVICIYLPSAAARQLLRDLSRSKAATADAHLRDLMQRTIRAIDRRGPVTYDKEAP